MCTNKLIHMNKQGWIIPIVIIAINALAIAVRWSSLPELMPAHFDLQGNASGSMSRNVLLLYPLASVAIFLVAFIIAHIKNKLKTGLTILSSGICLIMLSSTLVSLTYGKMPVFMLSEPLILILSLIAFIISIIRSRKNKIVPSSTGFTHMNHH